MKYQNIIIGSGPTGIIAAEEILNSGKEVAILDFGNKIEKDNHKIKKDFHINNDKSKFLKSIQKYKKVTKKYKNENLKFPFGSDYVFRENNFEKFKAEKNIDFLYSNAKGGLSNIWGTMYSPFYPKDIDSWDITYENFYKYGKEIEDLIPLLSGKDNLDNFFPINFGKSHNYPLSPNAKDYFLTNNIFLNLQLIWQRRIYKIDNDIITPIKDMIDRQLYGDEHEVFSIKNVGNFWEYSLPSLPSLLSNNDQGTEFDEYIISNDDVKIYNLDQNEIEMNEYDPETNKYKKNDFVLDSF